jgi:hypothetical protein
MTLEGRFKDTFALGYGKTAMCIGANLTYKLGLAGVLS